MASVNLGLGVLDSAEVQYKRVLTMIHFFYRENNWIRSSEGIEAGKALPATDVIWVDLFNPSAEERQFVEEKFKIELSTRQEALEIESSSKYYEEEEEINANINYIYRKEDNYALDPVSFILREGKLFSITILIMFSLCLKYICC